jgi:N-formylglutamate deformylase
MTDAFTDDLFASPPFEAARMVFPVSRLVCDVERFANDADEPMALRGMGAVYVKTSDEGPLREHLTPAEQARLIELWYRPHHQRLTQTVDDVISDGIIVGPGPGPAGHRIGTDGWNTPERLRAEQVAARQRLAILVDRPFAGALVPASIIGGRQRSRRS